MAAARNGGFGGGGGAGRGSGGLAVAAEATGHSSRRFRRRQRREPGPAPMTTPMPAAAAVDWGRAATSSCTGRRLIIGIVGLNAGWSPAARPDPRTRVSARYDLGRSAGQAFGNGIFIEGNQVSKIHPAVRQDGRQQLIADRADRSRRAQARAASS